MGESLYQAYLGFRKELEDIEVEVPEEYRKGIINRSILKLALIRHFNICRNSALYPI